MGRVVFGRFWLVFVFVVLEDVVDEEISCLGLVGGGGVFGEVGLQHLCVAESAVDFEFGAGVEVCGHHGVLDVGLAVFAGHFYFGDDFAGDAGGVQGDVFATAAGALSKFFDGLLDAFVAVYFGTAGTFNCVFGEFEAEGAGEIEFHVSNK